MRYLGLDVGTRRVGVAVGNSEMRLASPLRVIARSTLPEEASQILQLAREYDADALVVGVPHELDSSVGTQAELVLKYAEQLKEATKLPIEFHDERYSTAVALDRRREMGVSEKRGRATIDAAAAAIILQDFLDAQFTVTRGQE